MSNPVEKLPLYDRLLYEIGRTAQSQVHLERSLRQVHMALSSPGLAIYLSSNVMGIERLVQQCKKMLNKADIPKDVMDAGIVALTAAKVADDQRHRAIHDWWVQKEDSTPEKPQLTRHQLAKDSLGGYKVSEHDIEELKKIPETLQRAFYRVNALDWALWETLPLFREATISSTSQRNDSVEIMLDKFNVLPNGGVKVTS